MTHILVRCQCRAKLRLGFKVAGKVCRCPKCDAKFTAPDARTFGICGGQIVPVKPVSDKSGPKSEPRRAEVEEKKIGSDSDERRPCGTAHSSVRATISKMFVENGLDSNPAVSALALAAHPWTDDAVSPSVLDAIAAEMLPARNLNHHDIREVAIDRLLRIAESLLHESAESLAERYLEAAEELNRLPADAKTAARFRRPPMSDASADFVASPSGIGVPVSEAALNSDDVETVSPSKEMAESVAHLLGLAAATGSKDIGLVHGDEPTGVTIDELAQKLQVTSPLEDFDRHFANLDSRERDILLTRSFALDPPDTLEDVAARWKVTRERVRQLEMPLKADVLEKFETSFKRLGRPVLSRFTRTITRVDELFAAARSLGTGSRWRDAAAAVVLELLGPWKHTDRWSVHPSIDARVRDLKKQLESAADIYGLLSDEAVDQVFENLFHRDNDLQEYATEVLGLGRVCNRWTIRDTHRCRTVAALRFLGRPSTKEEVSELTGLPIPNVGSIFGTLEGVVRADKYRWGFEEWVEDSYEGIFEEINQRIDENGGVAPVSIIIRELPDRFGVSEASVRAYLSSDAFAIEDGLVRRAGDDEYTPKSPQSCTGAMRIEDKWGQRLRLYERHFVGYSLGVCFDIAYANGIRPDDDLVVPVNGDGYEGSVIWRRHSLTRAVDVGRVSQFLEVAGYSDGDEIVVIPQRDSVEILSIGDVAGRAVPNTPADIGNNDELTEDGQDVDDVHDPLLDLLDG